MPLAKTSIPQVKCQYEPSDGYDSYPIADSTRFDSYHYMNNLENIKHFVNFSRIVFSCSHPRKVASFRIDAMEIVMC